MSRRYGSQWKTLGEMIGDIAEKAFFTLLMVILACAATMAVCGTYLIVKETFR